MSFLSGQFSRFRKFNRTFPTRQVWASVSLFLLLLITPCAAFAQITYVNKVQNGANKNTDLQLNIPANTFNTGDFLVAMVSWRHGDGDLPIPTNSSNWVKLGQVASSTHSMIAVFYKEVTSSAADPVTFRTVSSNPGADGSESAGMIIGHSGVDLTDPIDGWALGSTLIKTVSLIAPAVTPTVTGFIALQAFSIEHSGRTSSYDFLDNVAPAADSKIGEVHGLDDTKNPPKAEQSLAVFSSTTAVQRTVTVAADDGDWWTTATVVLAPAIATHDFGDTPVNGTATPKGPLSAYGSPSHTPNANLYLGSPGDQPDLELATAFSADARGDNNAGTNDENGVSFARTAGQTLLTANVVYYNNTGSNQPLCGWLDGALLIDGLANGTFEASEGQCISVTSSAATGRIATFNWGSGGAGNYFPKGETYARFRITTSALTTSDANTAGLTGGEVEDYYLNLPPTVVTMGQVELKSISISDYLAELNVEQLDNAALMDLLVGWNAGSTEDSAGAERSDILGALLGYLDPDGDDSVAALVWDTLEERGTVGFYVERLEASGAWVRINNDLLPGLITAPMGGEYLLVDPAALPGHTYQYRLIELEAKGTTNNYGPYFLEMPK